MCYIFVVGVQAVTAANDMKIDEKVLTVCRAQKKSERIHALKSSWEKMKVCITISPILN